MAQPRPIPLRESEARPVDRARIIDADFKVVGRKRRFVGLLWRGLVTVFWAALIGFLIPPAWMLAQEIAAMFAPSA